MMIFGAIACVFLALFLMIFFGIGAVLCLAALAVGGVLLAVGIFSTSAVVALRQKSIGAGFSTFARLCGLLAGMFCGLVAVLVMLFTRTYPDEWMWAPLGVAAGGAAGFGVGHLAAMAVRWALEQLVRRIRRQCPECGYNLKGNTTGKCPECGGAVKATAVILPGDKPRG